MERKDRLVGRLGRMAHRPDVFRAEHRHAEQNARSCEATGHCTQHPALTQSTARYLADSDCTLRQRYAVISSEAWRVELTYSAPRRHR